MSTNSCEKAERAPAAEKEQKCDEVGAGDVKEEEEDEDIIDLSLGGLLEEPKGYYREPRKPTVEDYEFAPKVCASGGSEKAAERRTLHFHLVGSHPLWAHYLWNGGKHIAGMIQRGELPVAGKRVFEFGAGAAVPSVVAALCGARHVTITDFPEEPLLEPIRRNVAENITDEAIRSRVSVFGFLWGADVSQLLKAGCDGNKDDDEGGKYDVLLMGDLLANHTALPDLAKSASQLLKSDGIGIVAFGHHRPWLADRDLKIFEHLAKLGIANTKIDEIVASPMFAEDPGSLDVRKTIHVYKIFWQHQ